MNLKKSDKIIAVIAVLILIIAAVGIILYADTEEEVYLGNENEKKEYSFPIIDDPKPGTEETTSATFQKGFFYIQDETVPTIKFTVPVIPIKNIKFEVRYTDSQTSLRLFGILLKILGNPQGLDILKVTIIDPDEKTQTITISQGKKNITYENVNPPIYEEIIKAETEEEARMQLANLTSDQTRWSNEEFRIQASLTVRYKLHLLTRLRELFGRDTFTVVMSYDYYDYDLGEPEDSEEPPENPPTGSRTTYSSTPFASLTNTGFH